jgi:hypothetical protein
MAFLDHQLFASLLNVCRPHPLLTANQTKHLINNEEMSATELEYPPQLLVSVSTSITGRVLFTNTSVPVHLYGRKL